MLGFMSIINLPKSHAADIGAALLRCFAAESETKDQMYPAMEIHPLIYLPGVIQKQHWFFGFFFRFTNEKCYCELRYFICAKNVNNVGQRIELPIIIQAIVNLVNYSIVVRKAITEKYDEGVRSKKESTKSCY